MILYFPISRSGKLTPPTTARCAHEKEIVLTAVIGLESLLVEGSGDNNLRFWLRATKILSFFNDSALAIKDILLSAYNTRSKFVHGDSDSLDSALKKFDKTNNNQDRFVSLKNLLECLRVWERVTFAMSIYAQATLRD